MEQGFASALPRGKRSMRRGRLLSRLVVCLLLPVSPALAAEPEVAPADVQTLEQAHVRASGLALVDFFRQRTPPPGEPNEIRRLIGRLGDDSFQVRITAASRLVSLAGRAVPALQQASQSADPEVRRLAADCLRRIAAAAQPDLVAAAARVLAVRRPREAAAALLNYLPAARADAPVTAIGNALAVLAVHGGKPEPALLRALADESPGRRAAAGIALARAGVKEQLPAVHALLQDPEASVRLQVGLVLAELDDREAVPALIRLLDLLPRRRLWPVEEMLYRAAGEHSPAVGMGDSAESRRAFRDAWLDWWREHGAAADLKGPADPGFLDYTLLVLLDRGEALELDGDDKPRWQIDKLAFPLDAQVLPGDRLLVAENMGGRVTERHRSGVVLWQKEVEAPLVAQRLPDGNTFIANARELLEVDRDGAIVFSYTRPDGERIMRAARLPNGDLACVLMTQRFVRLDRAGHELQNFRVSVSTSGGRVHVLDNGHVLIPQMARNTVVEYDTKGNGVWTHSISDPIAAVRLPNGNTLITSMSEKRAVEVDAVGKTVWQYQGTDSRVTRAFRR
jgi:HEAT repeat protein